MADSIIPRSQEDELNDLSLRIDRARALIDVLTEMSAPGGDFQAGAIALEQLDPGSLYNTLTVLNDILIEAAAFLQVAWPDPPRMEVAHG